MLQILVTLIEIIWIVSILNFYHHSSSVLSSEMFLQLFLSSVSSFWKQIQWFQNIYYSPNHSTYPSITIFNVLKWETAYWYYLVNKLILIIAASSVQVNVIWTVKLNMYVQTPIQLETYPYCNTHTDIRLRFSSFTCFSHMICCHTMHGKAVSGKLCIFLLENKWRPGVASLSSRSTFVGFRCLLHISYSKLYKGSFLEGKICIIISGIIFFFVINPDGLYL